MIPRTSSGLIKFRPVRAGSRVALVAPASPFDRAEFDRGVEEIRRLGLEPVWDEDVFERQAITAGSPRVRVTALLRALDKLNADAVISVRGGYGSVELLPLLDAGTRAHVAHGLRRLQRRDVAPLLSRRRRRPGVRARRDARRPARGGAGRRTIRCPG